MEHWAVKKSLSLTNDKKIPPSELRGYRLISLDVEI